jgi:hypothetical protein
MNNNSDNLLGWGGYYQATQELPSPKFTEEFLRKIPSNGHILDFGSGTGRWAMGYGIQAGQT